MRSYPYTIDNGHGEELMFIAVTHDPAGERAEIEGSASPGTGPPMHVHYLQDETARVITGRMGYQLLGQGAQFAGPGEVVAWPAGTGHKWWNAGNTDLRLAGWCTPPGNIEFFLGALFVSTKENGGRPSLFDAAFLTTCYRTEHAVVEMPAVVRRLVLPILYVVGSVLGKYRKYRDAPEAMS